MKLAFVCAICVALFLMFASVAQAHGDHPVSSPRFRPVYYYPVDDDFDNIEGENKPNIVVDFQSVNSGAALACSFVLLALGLF